MRACSRNRSASDAWGGNFGAGENPPQVASNRAARAAAAAVVCPGPTGPESLGAGGAEAAVVTTGPTLSLFAE